MRIKRIFFPFLLVAMCFTAKAQQNNEPPRADSLSLTLDSAENMFLQNNFQLLAQKYNIDAQKALVIQAKLYPNPNINFATALYNPQAKAFLPLPFSTNGEVQAGISQLIILAGKRNKQVKLQQANVTLSVYQFYDLVRTLKYTLRTDFFNIYYLQQSAKVYDAEIEALQHIVNAYAQQQGTGYIAEKEIVRIKAQLYSFKSEYNDLINQINDAESELRLVLQTKATVFVSPVVDTIAAKALDPLKFSLTTLIDSAYKSRTDLLIAKANNNINKLNYDYQKSLAVPDLTANLSFDQQGSYVNNLSMAGVSIDLPFFNRNQGNIKSAKRMIDVTEATQKSVEATVEENVTRSLQKAIAEDNLYKGIDPSFTSEFEYLKNQVLINYQKRNIGLLDFLDFYDSYKQNALQLNSIQYNRVQALEDINFYTGTNFFN